MKRTSVHLALASLSSLVAVALVAACSSGTADLGGTSDALDGGGDTPITKQKGPNGACCPASASTGCGLQGGYSADGNCGVNSGHGSICDGMCEMRIVKDEYGCDVLSAKTPPKTTTFASADPCWFPAFNGCSGPSLTNPTYVAGPGDTLTPRPVGIKARLNFVYQGDAIWIESAKGYTQAVAPTSDAPLQAGANSGYWAEARDASGTTTFTKTFLDPTDVEGFPSGDAGFSHTTLDRCQAKSFFVDFPDLATTKTIVIFGSPYGTQNGATELVRFSLP